MFPNQMKQELIDKIISITDENILEEVYRIIEVGGKDIDRVVLSNQKKNQLIKELKILKRVIIYQTKKPTRKLKNG